MNIKTITLDKLRIFSYDSENDTYTKVVNAYFPNVAKLDITNGTSYNISNLTMDSSTYSSSFWQGTVDGNSLVVIATTSFTY